GSRTQDQGGRPGHGEHRLRTVEALRDARRAHDAQRPRDGKPREPRAAAADRNHGGGAANEDRGRERRSAAGDRHRRRAMTDLKAELVALARRQGFLHVAVAAAEEDREAREITLERVRAGSFAGLPWFDEAPVVRAAAPALALPGARSVVLLAASYRSRPPARGDGRLRGRVARYAWGRDYHRVLERRARPLVRLLGERVPGERHRLLVDHGPLAERAYARSAGLGWQ